MDPVFTLPYPEYAVANKLSAHFKRSSGYSIYIPISRQEKGVDLLLTKRELDANHSLTIQVKSSTTHSPKTPKSKENNPYNYYTWFNTFSVPKEADLFTLIALYPPDLGRTRKKSSSWWSAVILVFLYEEMLEFINNVKTKSGKPDRMFGFGFDDLKEIVLTRGGERNNYSNYLLDNRIDMIRNLF